MAIKNLENLKILDTYERVVQRVDGAYYDGTGSLLDIASSTDIPSTSSLLTTASATDNILTFTKGDGSTFDVTVATGSLAGYATETYVLLQTASLSSSLAVDIATNTTNLTNLTLAVLNNAANITANQINISTNTADIVTLTNASASFVTDINNLNGAISTVLGIALTNATDIGYLETSASNAVYTASAVDNVITFTKGDGSTFPITVDTGSGGTTDTGSLLQTASVSLNTITFTKGDGSTFPITVDTGSGGTTDTGSLLTTASADFSEITFTKGDGSTFIVDATPNRVIASVKNISGGTLAKGTPVHVTASASPPSGFVSEVVAADAGNSALMPCHYILAEELLDGAEGFGIINGKIQGVDTTAFSEGDTIYVAVGGGYTNVKPTGSALIQNIGVVTKVDATNGGGEVFGAGRSNDLPNLQENYVWLGDANGVPQAVPSSSIAGGGGGGVVTSYTNAVNNYVITSTGTGGITGESNLQFDGSTLTLTGDLSVTQDTTFKGDLTITGSIIPKLADATYTYVGELSPIAGATLTTGQVVYLDASTGWTPADASAEATTKPLLGVAVSATEVMTRGYIRDVAYAGLGTGNPLFLATTTGGITNAAPTTTGTFVRSIGFSADSTTRVVYFNPSNDYYENT